MSKHNYSKYANSNNKQSTVEDFVTTSINEPIDVEVAEVIEPVVESPKPVVGVVGNCKRLNVRVAPFAAATVACIIDAGAEVEINKAESTEKWYAVRTKDGTPGFCMKQFISEQM